MIGRLSFALEMSSWAVVEIECLRGVQGELCIKELAVVSDSCMDVFLIRPPYDWQTPDTAKQNQWIEQNLNGLYWHQGNIPYERLQHIIDGIARKFPVLYTKGNEKTQILRGLVGKVLYCNVIDMTGVGTPKFGDIIGRQSLRCLYHRGMATRLQCSLEKAFNFYCWLRGNFEGKLFYHVSTVEQCLNIFYFIFRKTRVLTQSGWRR